MKTTLFVVTIALLLSACDIYAVRTGIIPIKPYVVTDKWKCDVITCTYTAVDSKGNFFEFEDRLERYHVGDTIK